MRVYGAVLMHVYIGSYNDYPFNSHLG